MAKKSFAVAPKPKALSPAVPADAEMRLAFVLPVKLHSRFKSICAAQGIKMADVLRLFVERRTEELERGQ
jgi:hypothetical protein